MRDPNNPCLFCDIKKSGCAYENELAYASYDSYPVSEHHCLIIPKRHIKDYFDLTNDELLACNNLIKIIIATIPAVIVGFFIFDFVQLFFRDIKVVAVTSIVFAALLFVADHFKMKISSGFRSWKFSANKYFIRF